MIASDTDGDGIFETDGDNNLLATPLKTNVESFTISSPDPFATDPNHLPGDCRFPPPDGDCVNFDTGITFQIFVDELVELSGPKPTAEVALTNVCSFTSLDPGSERKDCIVNPGSGFIKIIKSTTGGDATFDFTLDGDPFASITTTGGTGSTGNEPVLGDETYGLAEVVPAGWALDSATCDTGDEPSSLYVGAGQVVTCSFVNSLAFVAPDISVEKTADPTQVDEPGGNVTFTLVVTNAATTGIGDATLDSLVDDIHGDLNGQGDCTVPQPLPGGGSYTCTFTTTVSGDAGYSETDTVTATASGPGGTDTATDDAVVIVADVLPTVDLVKDVSPASIAEPGGDFTYTLTITNTSVEPVTVTALTDDNPLPAECTELIGEAIPAGSSLSCTYTVSQTAPGSYDNMASVTVEDNEGNPVSDDDDAMVTVDDVASSIEVVKSATPETVDEPGGDVAYTFTVNNTSAVDSVTIDTLDDSIHGDLNGQGDCSVPQTIVAGGSYSCSITVAVSGNAGDTITNVATASGFDDDGSPVSDDDDAVVTVDDVASSIEVVKSATPETVDEPGGDVAYTFTVNNTSAVDSVTIDTLDDSIHGDLNGQGDCSVPQTIVAGGSYSCSITVAVSGNAGDTITNVATASGFDDDGSPVSDDDDAVVTVDDVASSIEVVKSATPETVDEPGGDVAYTFTVNNTSAVDSVTIDTLDDSIHGDLNGQGDCSVPQTIVAGGSYSCSITVAVSGNAGDTITNVATASGFDDDGSPVSDDDDAVVTVNDVASSIEVVKLAGTAANGEIYEIPENGGLVGFTVTITNTSPVDTVTIDSLLDDQFSQLIGAADSDCAAVTLAPTESATCTFDRVVSGNAGDTHANVVTASGLDDDGGPVSGSDDAVVAFTDVPSEIEVVKSATPETVDEPGGDVAYTFTVNNTSAVDSVTIDTLDDSIHGDLNGQGDCSVPQTIVAGGSYSCSITVAVSGNADDVITNLLTVAGSDDDGNPVGGADDATVTISDVPSSILTTKTASPTSVPETGGDITFTIAVENTSAVDTVTINSVSDDVFGDVSGSCTPALPAILAPDESIACTFTEFISGDADQVHTNVATATGVDDDGNPVEDDDQEDVPFDDVLPEISIIKMANPTSVPETGGNVTFTFVVANNALEEATLDALVDSDFGDLNGQGTCATPQTLASAGAAGDSYTCSMTVFLSGDASGPAHSNVVTATASDDDGNTDEATDDETVPFDDVLPDITVTKTPSVDSVPETGGLVDFEIVVTNNSAEEATLVGLGDTVYGDLNGIDDCAYGPSVVLAPNGGTYTCTVKTFLSGDASGPVHNNLVTATASDDDDNTDSASDDATVSFDDVLPDISITKTADPTSVDEPGGNVAFTLVVTNNSLEEVNIDSLTDSEYDEDLSASCPEATDINLQYNQSYTCVFTAFVAGNAVDGPHANTATVVASDDDGNTDEASDDATVTINDVAPSIVVTKTPNQDEVFAPGEEVIFTIRVEHDSASSDPITITSIEDDVFGDVSEACVLPQTIGVGGAFECDITWLVTEDHTNTVTVTAEDDEGNEVTESASASVEYSNPAISVEKWTNSVDADAAPGPEILVGSDVLWQISVTNTGDVTMTVTDISDDQGVTLVCPPTNILNPGDTITCAGFGTSEAGQYTNVGSASATYTDADGDVAERTDTDPSHYFGASPSISIDKTTVFSGNEGDSIGVLPGGAVAWKYHVENTGTVALENVFVTDDQGVTVTCPQDALAVGESMTCIGMGTAQEGSYSNVGTASGDYSDDVGNSTTVTDSDGSSYYGLPAGDVTNSSLCDFGDQFRLIFTPDFVSGNNLFKLSDSNPGQFFYNVFYDAAEVGTTVTMEIPYPFVTQGGNPVHAYGGLFVDDTGPCYDPVDELYNNALTFDLGDYGDSNGDGVVGFGDVYTVEVTGLPESGFVYLNIHLDYGLEKTNGWYKNIEDALNNSDINPDLDGVDILNNTAHEFGSNVPDSSDTIYNQNEWKRIRGIGGLVSDGSDPVEGETVQLQSTDGTLLDTAVTDEDGWYYFLDFVHRGREATYTVTVAGLTDTATLGGRVKWQQVDFVIE